MTGNDRLFTIDPGVPFLETLAHALMKGQLVKGFNHDRSDPLSLADATIFVPTRRAARALRSQFCDLIGSGSAILPVIRPLGEMDEDAGYFDETSPQTLSQAPPIGRTDMLLELAQLILAWKRALPHSVSALHGDKPLVTPVGPADAVWLARALSDLIVEMESEERPWAMLDEIDPGDHAEWWQLTLEFLKIARDFWPARLEERGLTSPGFNRNATLKAIARRLETHPPPGPVIMAGSTGTLPATANLIATVLNMEKGAVVLPGLDRSMRQEHWQPLDLAIAAARARSLSPTRIDKSLHQRDTHDPTLPGHPQYGLSLLLDRLRVGREEARPLGHAEPFIALRNRIVSSAFLPAEGTADWPDLHAQFTADEIVSAFATVTLIETENEREEAQAIALAIRRSLLDGEASRDREIQVALITPDRNLARRVTLALARFGIEANDSGGRLLETAPQATLLALIHETIIAPGDPVTLLSLLKHPLARFGLDAKTLAEGVNAIERIALRGGTGEVDVSTLTTLLETRIESAQQDRHAPEWLRRIDEPARMLARDLAERMERAVEPLVGFPFRIVGDAHERQVSGRLPLADWAAATARVLEAVAIDADGSLDALWGDEAGENLARLIGDVIAAPATPAVNGEEWVSLFPALLAGELVKPRAASHASVFIWGTLEARLQQVDTVILAGLNEDTWPQLGRDDPFLSRGMRQTIGLEPPERRIGQAAHDLQMALGTKNVILSRAGREGSAPTVASRWLQRLTAFLGEKASENLRSRGNDILALAAALDDGEPRKSAERPEPRPPAERQPDRYSFSEVKTLRRDPYAIYARRILRLDPFPPLIADPSFGERGTLYHDILDAFFREPANLDRPLKDATAQLMALADLHFKRANIPLHIAALWRPRFEKVAHQLIDWEKSRETPVHLRKCEAAASYHFADIGITLTGRADRIDMLDEKTAVIIDYKTGTDPSAKQARSLLDPQLALEAAVLSRGGFRDLPALKPHSLCYIRLRPGDGFKVEKVEKPASDEDGSIAAACLGERSLTLMGKLVTHLREGRNGFASRLIPVSARHFGNDYDHLARVAEWSTAETDEMDASEP